MDDETGCLHNKSLITTGVEISTNNNNTEILTDLQNSTQITLLQKQLLLLLQKITATATAVITTIVVTIGVLNSMILL